MTLINTRTHNRYVFIDALRGIAALGVLLHHLYHNSVMEDVLHRILPGLFISLCDFGAYGVEIFFVLSGFVISHSLRDNALTGKSIGNFMLRRQLRLDPPYWIMLLIVLGLHRAELAVPSLHSPPMSGLGVTLLNFLYLHKIFNVEQILGVAWTLCIEIQFYLVFIVLLFLGNRIFSRSEVKSSPATVALVSGLGVLSMACARLANYDAWFINYWFYFAAGVLCYWSVQKQIARWLLPAFVILFFGDALMSVSINVIDGRSSTSTAIIVGAVTTVLIYLVGIKGHLTDWWNNRVVQYLGRISYSLYLVHLVTLELVMRIGFKVTGENEKLALVWFVLAGLVTIGAAQLLHILVEMPSMRYATRLKGQPIAVTHPVSPAVTPTADDIEESESGFGAESEDAL